MFHRLNLFQLLFVTGCFLLITSLAYAVPGTINYQGVLTDSGGSTLSGDVTIEFRLFDTATAGTELWNETQTVTVQNGLYNVQLGASTALSSLNFSSNYWLEIEVEGETLTPRQQLLTVPYAFRAEHAATADNALTASDLSHHTHDSSAHHSRYTDAEAVAAVNGSTLNPGTACMGAGQALQWNGSQWTCVSLQQLTPSAGEANGYEVDDDWGFAWDGISRGYKTWQEAKTICEADGGRLPTVTELYRNNATSGSGNIASIVESGYLWTQITDDDPLNKMTVRLSDGGVSTAVATNTAGYRCVWPTAATEGFSGTDCYGPTGGECQDAGRFENVDSYDRPAMSYAAAANECSFYEASLLTTRDFQELIQGGLPNGSNYWLRTTDAKYWYSNGYGTALARWSGGQDQSWAYTGSTTGSMGPTTNSYAFRCIGQKQTVDNATTASCEGGCFQVDSRRSRMWIDSTDRAAATQPDAAETCRLLGGSLPEQGDLAEAIHAGLPNGTNAWLWSSDPLYWYNGGYGYALFRFNGTGAADWQAVATTTMSRVEPTQSFAYRCVWHDKIEASPTVCAINEKQVWNGSGYECQPSAYGDSNGNAIPPQFIDPWGNAWDHSQRAAADFSTAESQCTANGGRLPTPTELYRVRANQSLVTSIGDASTTDYLWTLISDDTLTQRVTLRLSDGATSAATELSSIPYRCVWPVEKGDVFGSRSCYGVTADPCFQSGDLRMDSYDRAAMPQSSAAQECAYFGGRLPDGGEFQNLIHAGAPNGSSNWLWISDPVYWHSSNYGYAIGQWSGTGQTSWAFDSSAGSVSKPSDSRAFRCIFSNAED